MRLLGYNGTVYLNSKVFIFLGYYYTVVTYLSYVESSTLVDT